MAKEKEEKQQQREQGESRAMQPDQQRGGMGRERYGTGGGRGLGARELGRPMTPFSFVRRMMDDVDRLFGGSMLASPFFDTDDLSIGGSGGMSALWSPQVEVFQKNGELVVRADLPGMNKDDVRVHVEDDSLTIEGERKSEQEELREGFYHSERSYGSFQRRIPIPRGVDMSTCDAVFENGVLEVKLKLPKEQKQSVQIRGASGQTQQQQTKEPTKEQSQQKEKPLQPTQGQPPNGPAPQRH